MPQLRLIPQLSSVEGVATYSAPRFWPRCEGELVGSIHIQLARSASAHDPTVQHLLIITILPMERAFEAHRQEVERGHAEQIRENNGRPVPAALDFYDGTQ